MSDDNACDIHACTAPSSNPTKWPKCIATGRWDETDFHFGRWRPEHNPGMVLAMAGVMAIPRVMVCGADGDGDCHKVHMTPWEEEFPVLHVD